MLAGRWRWKSGRLGGASGVEAGSGVHRFLKKEFGFDK